MNLSKKQRLIFAQGANKIAEEVLSKSNLKTVFHHHCGGYIETPDEIDYFMKNTDENLIGLCFAFLQKNFSIFSLDPNIYYMNTVPINFSVNCSMINDDYPEVVHILVLDNPFPEIAKFYFTPQSGEAELSIRIRMRTSSNIIAIAEMADGTIGQTQSFVDVTIGACSYWLTKKGAIGEED